MIKIIVAASSNLVIGKENDLPWNLPTDMKHFKTVTSGHTVLMGRKCWESIPAKYRPLPNRKNIVLTRNTEYVAEGAQVAHNLQDVLKKYKNSDETLFVIGGAEIYDESFEMADYMFFTHIFDEVDGDVKLNKLDFQDWEMTDIDDLVEENGLKFRIEFYQKKNLKSACNQR